MITMQFSFNNSIIQKAHIKDINNDYYDLTVFYQDRGPENHKNITSLAMLQLAQNLDQEVLIDLNRISTTSNNPQLIALTQKLTPQAHDRI